MGKVGSEGGVEMSERASCPPAATRPSDLQCSLRPETLGTKANGASDSIPLP